ncbi:hypothetical protein [Halodesulfovibrio sp.]|uniref:hypothetical protein n=1 Tax=Halodesulfovibrio sp. TaxID=1912772 RepID=UPI0025C2D30E|nr:hypothetical protein [Halodesulfovibrio sp.]
MFRILCSLLCSFIMLCMITPFAHGAKEKENPLPPPVTKEISTSWTVDPDWQTSTYSFFKEEFINPKIVEEMQGPLSDSGSQILSINVHNANISNQFFSEVHVRTTEAMPYVYYKDGDSEFGYIYVGATTGGINIVHTLSFGSGSGVFHTLLFFVFTKTESMTFGLEVRPVEQPTLTLIGSLPLGDRFAGTINLENDVLKVLPSDKFRRPLPLYKGGLILRFTK